MESMTMRARARATRMSGAWTSPLAAAIEMRLQARSSLEKAFFDESPASYPLLIVVAAVWGVELFANFVNGEGWVSIAHWAVVVPLELCALLALALGTRSLWWRARLGLLRRRGRRRQAALRQTRVGARGS